MGRKIGVHFSSSRSKRRLAAVADRRLGENVWELKADNTSYAVIPSDARPWPEQPVTLYA